MSCDELRELAPEIALGTIDGAERGEALRHLATCAECRRLVDRLAAVADELLVVAPLHEPPAGFETRVIGGLEVRPRRRRARRTLLRLAPAAAAAAIAAGVVAGAYHDDRVTAERYRDTLAQAGGRYFEAARLRAPTGARAGVAFGYQGRPSWVLVTVDAAYRDRVRSAQLLTSDGRTIGLPDFELRNGSWGGAIPVPIYRIAAVRLLGDRPGEVLTASLREEN
jgi:hypothetical protein